MKHIRWFAALVALLVLTGACTRSDGDVETGTEEDPQAESSNEDEDASDSDDATALSAGGFGDLEAVCQDGDASGATATGVTDTEIRLGTVTDKGNAAIPGLNKEMYDAAVAFVEWCNEHGGIVGRQLVLDDMDAKLSEYDTRMTEACGRNFALVGGGAVFDEDKTGIRVGCDLANVPGFVVSPDARVADLQVQPVPNPVYTISAGRYVRAAELYPEAIESYGIMAASTPSVLGVRDQLVEVAESLDYNVAYSREFAPLGETGWPNFVRELEQEDVQILEFVGEPESFTGLTKAMDTAGWYPEVILVSPNFYDSKYQQEGGALAGNTLIQSQFFPFEMAEENKATQDYLDLMEQYNPDGKVALLGTQGLSGWLLFAQAATACASDLTAECLLEEARALEDWTGGGLHAPQSPGNVESSPCFLLVTVDAEGFTYDEEATAPNEGIYNCDPSNVVELENDYGVTPPEQ